MNDLKAYRMNSFDEIEDLRKRIGNDKFRGYIGIVYFLLNRLEPGERFDICEKVKQANRMAFVKVACLYISETGGNCNIEFSDDYSRIKGIKSYNAQEAEIKQAIRIRRGLEKKHRKQ
ncbi:MAG: hypothetical protein LBJ39_01165 [Tannerellaceae bacterium]|jgi:hypothetical protein|nr:hypothetical protein [Tannerellaceae bacterium]